jgi:hypothetical protein
MTTVPPTVTNAARLVGALLTHLEADAEVDARQPPPGASAAEHDLSRGGDERVLVCADR